MNDTTELAPKWAARIDAFRPTQGFNDLIKIVSAYYEMYEKGCRFLVPWTSRQNGSNMPFRAPTTEEIRSAVGKPRSVIHPVIYHSFTHELNGFSERTKGKRQLITPHQTTHHSAQFTSGTFTITKVDCSTKLSKPNSKQRISLHSIEIFGADEPIYVENLQLTPEQVKFIIVRPKIGKLGTASVLNWEVLFFKSAHGYLINHVDSSLNPRWSGVL